jgi:hypothetical protein
VRGHIDIASKEVVAQRNVTNVNTSVMPDKIFLKQIPVVPDVKMDLQLGLHNGKTSKKENGARSVAVAG